MKIKTNDLTGAALDWAVAKCENSDTSIEHFVAMHSHYAYDHGTFDYSTKWAQGGPIIEREKATLSYDEDGQTYSAHVSLFRQRGMSNRTRWRSGPTPLVAAMRCYVASKLGNEVEVPEELIATISAIS